MATRRAKKLAPDRNSSAPDKPDQSVQGCACSSKRSLKDLASLAAAEDSSADSSLASPDDLPPGAAVQRFIFFYVNERDLQLAATKAGLEPEMGERLYREPKVRAAIEKKIHLVDVEHAKLAAQALSLNVSLLDASLAEEVKNKKSGAVRMRAIELGYKRTGVMRDGEFVLAPDPDAARKAPSIYQSRQTILRRTVTEEMLQTTATELPTDETSLNLPQFKVLEY